MRRDHRRSKEIVRAAEVETKATFLARQEEFEKVSAGTRNEIREAEKRIDKREDQLERKLDMLGIKERNIEKAEATLQEQTTQVEQKTKEIDELLAQERNQLLKITQLSISAMSGAVRMARGRTTGLLWQRPTISRRGKSSSGAPSIP